MLLNPTGTATCTASTEFFDASVFECNLCVGGAGESSAVDPLLVGLLSMMRLSKYADQRVLLLDSDTRYQRHECARPGRLVYMRVSKGEV